ncbi:MAG: hypothetical protein IR153_04475 [Flavobacterium sp.]|nr:hypothetical protein [Flavobacterium sp.]
MKQLLIISTLLFQLIAFGQSREIITAQVVSSSDPVAGAIIVNISTEKEVFSDENGNFKMLLGVGDFLIISHPSYEYRRTTVTATDLKSNPFVINVFPITNQLQEVVVTNTAKDDLVMRHKDKKKFTPGERRLYAANSGPVDIIINALSGRTNMLKKELQVEMNERLLARIETIWPPEFYTETLQIPEDYIKGFQLYLIGDAEFVAAVRARNKTLMEFLVSKQAADYNKIISGE